MKFSFLILATLALIFAATAFAANNPQPRGTAPQQTPRQVFDTIDTSKDGMIDKEEARKYLLSLGAPHKELDKIISEIFKGEDANKDGVISWEEWYKVNGPHFAAPASTSTTGGAAMGTMETFSLHNNHMTHVLSSFIDGSNNSTDDEEHEDDEEDDGSFLVMMTDKLFCPSQDNEDEDCIYLAVPSTNCANKEELCYIVCKTDEETDEDICYQIALEAEEDSA